MDIASTIHLFTPLPPPPPPPPPPLPPPHPNPRLHRNPDERAIYRPARAAGASRAHLEERGSQRPEPGLSLVFGCRVLVPSEGGGRACLTPKVVMDELSPESGDEHVKDLADRVRKIAERQVGVEAEACHTKIIDHELKRVTSTDEKEETEK
ncbi:hypothetical protein NHQ30_009131 [Ciborinia camelliae]|nr:hypothetical protein NHQ30_009131 [Ciborinia camelliae]